MDQRDIKIGNSYTVVLACIAAVLVMAHCLLNYAHYEIQEIPWLIRQLFDLDEENNLPTWFSGFLLLNCAAVLFLSQTVAETRLGWHWRLLAIGFLILSIDEVAGLHETFHTSIDFNWAIPAAILVGIVGLAFVPFLLALPRKLAVWFVVAGAIYVSGAIVVEWFSRDMDEDSLAYTFATALEESMEMLGAWLFLRLNINALKDRDFRITFS